MEFTVALYLAGALIMAGHTCRTIQKEFPDRSPFAKASAIFLFGAFWPWVLLWRAWR